MTGAVLFDIDGTLIDSVDLHTDAWVEALAHFHVVVPRERMRPEIGKGADQLLPLFLPGDKLAAERERIAAFRAELFRRDYLPNVKPFPAVPDLFRRLRADGVRIVLASSGKAEEVKVYARIAGVTDLVDATTSGDDADRSKPQPDIFEAALARIAPVRPAEVLVVGDTPWDMIAAGRAGLRAIGVLCGGVDAATLREAGAVATFDGPADLLGRYAELPLGT